MFIRTLIGLGCAMAVTACSLSQRTAFAFAAWGVQPSVVRMPQIHDKAKQGFATYMVEVARAKGVSAYIGDGTNCWSAVNRLDAARLFRTALEASASNAVYHAVAEEAIPLKTIAESIGAGLNLPVVSLSPDEGRLHFGWLARVVGGESSASSALTRNRLGWRPMQKATFLDDLERALSAGTLELRLRPNDLQATCPWR